MYISIKQEWTLQANEKVLSRFAPHFLARKSVNMLGIGLLENGYFLHFIRRYD